jgi:hypothetical protein
LEAILTSEDELDIRSEYVMILGGGREKEKEVKGKEGKEGREGGGSGAGRDRKEWEKRERPEGKAFIPFLVLNCHSSNQTGPAVYSPESILTHHKIESLWSLKETLKKLCTSYNFSNMLARFFPYG